MENIYRGDLDIVYINLDKSTERMASMEEKLSQFFKPSDFKRFQAIKGDNRDAKIGKNELGCFLSHFEIIQSSSQNHPTLILEDDVKFCKNFNTYLKNILKGLPRVSPDWDILFLAQMTDIRAVKKTAELLKIIKNIPIGTFRILDAQSHYVSSCSSYVINPLSKDKILNALKLNEEKAYPLPIDICLKRAIDDKRLNCKFVFPYLTGLEGIETTIAKNKLTDNVSRLLEDQLNLFFVDSNPPDLLKKYLHDSVIGNNQHAYFASQVIFKRLVLYTK